MKVKAAEDGAHERANTSTRKSRFNEEITLSNRQTPRLRERATESRRTSHSDGGPDELRAQAEHSRVFMRCIRVYLCTEFAQSVGGRCAGRGCHAWEGMMARAPFVRDIEVGVQASSVASLSPSVRCDLTVCTSHLTLACHPTRPCHRRSWRRTRSFLWTTSSALGLLGSLPLLCELTTCIHATSDC